jgi:hypothetical protein
MGHGLTLTTHEHPTHWAPPLQWSRQPCKAMPHHTWRLTFRYSTNTISELEAPETSLTMISPCPPPTWSSVLCFCSLMKHLAQFQGKESIAESHISHISQKYEGKIREHWSVLTMCTNIELTSRKWNTLYNKSAFSLLLHHNLQPLASQSFLQLQSSTKMQLQESGRNSLL